MPDEILSSNPKQADPVGALGPLPLARALDRSELVREKVEECATELSSVNLVLKRAGYDDRPVQFDATERQTYTFTLEPRTEP